MPKYPGRLSARTGYPALLFNMKHFVRKMKTLGLLLVGLILLAGCSRKAELTPQPTQSLPPAPLNFTYCDIDRADICLEGFGLGSEEELMVMFIVDDPLYADIYIRADGPDGEILFKCQESEVFTENVYCIGEPFPEGERIKLNLYSKSSNKFFAIGVFNVAIGALPESDVIFHSTTTPVPSLQSYPPPTAIPSQRPTFPSASPTPSLRPSYQNPSYPNWTSTPTPTHTSTPTPTSTPTQ